MKMYLNQHCSSKYTCPLPLSFLTVIVIVDHQSQEGKLQEMVQWDGRHGDDNVNDALAVLGGGGFQTEYLKEGARVRNHWLL